MPLAFFADHRQARTAWDRCIDINLKGVINGIAAYREGTLDAAFLDVDQPWGVTIGDITIRATGEHYIL